MFTQLAAVEDYCEAAEVVLSPEAAELVAHAWELEPLPDDGGGKVLGPLFTSGVAPKSPSRWSVGTAGTEPGVGGATEQRRRQTGGGGEMPGGQVGVGGELGGAGRASQSCLRRAACSSRSALLPNTASSRSGGSAAADGDGAGDGTAMSPARRAAGGSSPGSWRRAAVSVSGHESASASEWASAAQDAGADDGSAGGNDGQPSEGRRGSVTASGGEGGGVRSSLPHRRATMPLIPLGAADGAEDGGDAEGDVALSVRDSPMAQPRQRPDRTAAGPGSTGSPLSPSELPTGVTSPIKPAPAAAVAATVVAAGAVLRPSLGGSTGPPSYPATPLALGPPPPRPSAPLHPADYPPNAPPHIKGRLVGVLQMHVPGSVRSHAMYGHVDFLTENRQLTCLFLGFPTLLAPQQGAGAAEQLGCVQMVVAAVQEVMRKWEGSFLQVRGCGAACGGGTRVDKGVRCRAIKQAT